MAGTTSKHLTLEAARGDLSLRRDEFALGIEQGVIRTCWSGGELLVRVGEVARWRANPGELAELTRLVHATEAAGLAGITRHRFDQLARAGVVRPVRSYVNRYHAEVSNPAELTVRPHSSTSAWASPSYSLSRRAVDCEIHVRLVVCRCREPEPTQRELLRLLSPYPQQQVADGVALDDAVEQAQDILALPAEVALKWGTRIRPPQASGIKSPSSSVVAPG